MHDIAWIVFSHFPGFGTSGTACGWRKDALCLVQAQALFFFAVPLPMLNSKYGRDVLPFYMNSSDSTHSPHENAPSAAACLPFTTCCIAHSIGCSYEHVPCGACCCYMYGLPCWHLDQHQAATCCGAETVAACLRAVLG